MEMFQHGPRSYTLLLLTINGFICTGKTFIVYTLFSKLF